MLHKYFSANFTATYIHETGKYLRGFSYERCFFSPQLKTFIPQKFQYNEIVISRFKELFVFVFAFVFADSLKAA